MKAQKFPPAPEGKPMSAGAVFAAGWGYLAALAILDWAAPGGMNFQLLYLLGPVWVGWNTGKYRAATLATASAVVIAVYEWGASARVTTAGIFCCNSLTYLLVLFAISWLAAEAGQLTRDLALQLAERTAQLEREAAERRETADSLARALTIGRLAMEEMTAAREKLEHIQGHNPATSYACNATPPFGVTYVSENVKEHFGFEAREFLEDSSLWRNQVHPADVPDVNKALDCLLQDGERVFECRFRNKHGQFRWVLHHAKVVRDSKGEVQDIVGFVLDITDRKRSEFLLQAQRDLGVSLSLTNDLQSALSRLLDIAIQVEGLDCGGVYLFEPTTGDLCLVVQRGLSRRFVEQVSRYGPESPPALLVKAGRPVYDLLGKFPPEQKPLAELEHLGVLAVFPLCHKGQALGSLNLASHVEPEISAQTCVVIEAIAAQAAGAIARLRIQDALQQSQKQILDISDREQARIGQDIHDGLCQQLVSLAFDANLLEQQLVQHGSSEAVIARRLAALLDQTISESRQVARGLFPVRLDVEGLAAALEELAESTRERFQTECRLENHCVVSLPAHPAATHIYRIAQEAIMNAVKHGRPRNIRVRISTDAHQLHLTVEDDGRGISSAAVAGVLSGMGLKIMEYRARTLGGTFAVYAGHPNGTTVSCCFPLAGTRKSTL
jgi:PAS domain S-box-containing protein